MLRGLILAAMLAAPLWAGAAGMITILEGDALVLRGSSRMHAVEGLPLALGDIVDTGSATFMQVELADQTVAQFGPSTKVMINSSPARQKPERWIFLMEGWAKVTGPKREPNAASSGYDLRTPLVEVAAGPSVVVVRQTAAESMLFVERGEARVTERPVGATPSTMGLRAGDHYRRKAGLRGGLNPGAMQSFVQEMPRFFRDSLPLRAERYKDRPARAKDAPDFAYADVESWLKAEPAVRRPLVQRWRGKAREPAFRSALISNLPAHPEWDPVLFPEKYLPKPKPPVPPASVPAP